MAAPVVSTRGVSQSAAASATPAVNFPADLEIGHKVICVFFAQGGAAQDASFPEGWTRLAEAGTGGGGGPYIAVAEYTVEGGEDATFTVGINSEESAHYTWAGPFGEITVLNNPPDGGAGTTATYPAISGLDSGDYLFISACGTNDNTAITTPADYVEERYQDTGGGDAVSLRVAENPLTGVTGETPGNSTISATEDWLSLTIAVANPAAPAGDMVATAAPAFSGSAVLNALGALVASGALAFSPGATLNAAANLTAAGSAAFSSSAALNASGSLVAAGAQSFAADADLDFVATDDVVATGELSFAGTADLDATGSLAATGAAQFASDADLDAVGNLVASATAQFTADADLDASGALSSTGAMQFASDADLDALGALAATGDCVFDSSAALTATAEIAASSACAFTGTADLSASGTLEAVSALTFAGAGLLGEEVFNYRPWGIPYLTDDLPSGLMPTLPTPFGQAGWPYDPLTLTAPTPEEHWPDPDTAVTGSYYIDNTHGSATDSGNTYGTRNTPRLTPPGDNTTFPEGAVMYMVGGGDWYPIAIDRVNWTSEGTAENPCWLLGTAGATFTRPTADNRCSIIISGTHFIARDVRLEIENDQDIVQFHIGSLISGTPAQYICFENIEATNNGASSANGAGVVGIQGDSSARTQFVVLYNCDIHEVGLYETNPTQLDHHCVRPGTYCDYIWIIDCNLSQAGADSIQCGFSGNTDEDPATRCHYIWIAGCTMTANFENSLDTKNSFHVILAQNDIWDFHNASFPANNTAVLINNEEGDFASYKWINANRIWDFGGPGIRDSGDHEGERNYIFNNLIYQGGSGASKSNAGTDTQSWVFHNTFYDVTGDVISGDQAGTDVEHHVQNNIFSECGNADTGSFAVATFHNNIWHNSGTIAVGFDQDGTITSDPLLVDPENGDLTILSGSPALGAAPQLDAWDDFETLYGLDIRYDFAGNQRPASGAGNHTIGAYELASSVEPAATGDMAFSSSAELTATGSLAASTAIEWSASASLTEADAEDLDGSGALSFSGSAALTASGTLEAAGATAFASAADLTPIGVLVAAGQIALGSDADLKAYGALQAVGALEWGSSAALVDAFAISIVGSTATVSQTGMSAAVSQQSGMTATVRSSGMRATIT